MNCPKDGKQMLPSLHTQRDRIVYTCEKCAFSITALIIETPTNAIASLAVWGDKKKE